MLFEYSTLFSKFFTNFYPVFHILKYFPHSNSHIVPHARKFFAPHACLRNCPGLVAIVCFVMKFLLENFSFTGCTPLLTPNSSFKTLVVYVFLWWFALLVPLRFCETGSPSAGAWLIVAAEAAWDGESSKQ